MPGMDGVEALGKILSKNRATPVIFYSAYPAFKMNFLTWSAAAFVEKTGNPHELLEAVWKVSRENGIPIPEPQSVPEAVAPGCGTSE